MPGTDAPAPGARPSEDPDARPSGASDPDARDPGLQPERTRLAWRRTTLAGTVATVLAMRTALHDGPSATGTVLCAVFCGLWLAFLAVAHRRMVTLASTPRPPVLSSRLAAAAVLCTVATAVCAAALVLA